MSRALLLLLLPSVVALGAATDGTVTFLLVAGRSGEVHHCGCSAMPLGGLRREFRYRQAAKLDGGETPLSLSVGPEFVGGAAKGAAARADVIVDAMNLFGVSALAPAAADLELGVETLKTLERKARFPFVSANLADDRGRPRFRPFALLGGDRVWVTGIARETAKGPAGRRVLDAAKALTEVMSGEPSRKARLRVVLTDLDGPAVERLAARHPSVNVWITPATTELDSTVTQIGVSQLHVAVGPKGMGVGKLSLPLPSGELRFFEPTTQGLREERARLIRRQMEALDRRLAKTMKAGPKAKLLREKGDLVRKLAETEKILVARESAVTATFDFQPLSSRYDGGDAAPMEALLERLR